MNKKELRALALKKRRNVKDKAKKDEAIINRLVNLDCFKRAKTVLCYASLPDEIETDGLISLCLNEKKNTAVPLCRDREGNMDFYLITSFDDLTPGMFGVREPDGKRCEKLSDFSGSIIVVPGLSFDKTGRRLGYGKGYYDRFLENYPFISAGLCYNMLIEDEIPTDEFDRRVDIVLTEDGAFGSFINKTY